MQAGMVKNCLVRTGKSTRQSEILLARNGENWLN